MRLRRNVNERTSVKDEIHPDLKTKQKYYCLGQRKKNLCDSIVLNRRL